MFITWLSCWEVEGMVAELQWPWISRCFSAKCGQADICKESSGHIAAVFVVTKTGKCFCALTLSEHKHSTVMREKHEAATLRNLRFELSCGFAEKYLANIYSGD